MFAWTIPQNPKTTLPAVAVNMLPQASGQTTHLEPGGAGNDTACSSDQEARLVQAARAGDLSAFNCLVLAHQDGLYGWALSLVHDEAQAADLTQSTLITAYEKLHQFRDGSFRAWLFRIARNRAIDEIRRSKRFPIFSLDAPKGNSADEDAPEWSSYLPDHTPQPERALELSQQAEQIEDLLARLPEMFQQVLRLIDMEGLDYQEAAAILELPLGTIKSRVARARLKLRHLVVQSGLNR